MTNILESRISEILNKGYTYNDIKEALVMMEAKHDEKQSIQEIKKAMIKYQLDTSQITKDGVYKRYQDILNRTEPYSVGVTEEISVRMRPTYQNGLLVKDYVEIVYMDKGEVHRHYSKKVK